jgi:hypothetical protein
MDVGRAVSEIGAAIAAPLTPFGNGFINVGIGCFQ